MRRRAGPAEAEEALNAQPDDSAMQTVAAASLNQLAAELAFGGELGAALEQLGPARGVIQASPGAPVRDARQVRILLFILNAESRFRARLGDGPGANAVAEDALRLAEDALNRDPSDRWSQMAVAAAAAQLGRCLTESGDAPGAVPRFWRALAIAERAISEDPDYEVARREAASARYGLGRALLAQGAPSLEPEACDVLRGAEAFWSQRQSEIGSLLTLSSNHSGAPRRLGVAALIPRRRLSRSIKRRTRRVERARDIPGRGVRVRSARKRVLEEVS